MLKQFIIILVMSIIFGGLLTSVSFLYFHQGRIGAVLGLSLFFAMASSVVTGLFIPYFFSRMKFDPANASGPIATIIQDIMSVLIYFTVASLLL
jgi:magnesium transporter